MIVLAVGWWLVGVAVGAIVVGVVLAFVGLALAIAVTCDLRAEEEEWMACRDRFGVER